MKPFQGCTVSLRVHWMSFRALRQSPELEMAMTASPVGFRHQTRSTTFDLLPLTYSSMPWQVPTVALEQPQQLMITSRSRFGFARNLPGQFWFRRPLFVCSCCPSLASPRLGIRSSPIFSVSGVACSRESTTIAEVGSTRQVTRCEMK